MEYIMGLSRVAYRLWSASPAIAVSQQKVESLHHSSRTVTTVSTEDKTESEDVTY